MTAIAVEKTSMQATRIAIVDHQTLLRESLCACLNRRAGIEVVWSCGNSNDALLQIRKNAPDVLVIDVEVPGICVFELTRRILTHHRRTKVVFLTNNHCDAFVAQAMKLKVCGYLLKDESLGNLIESVKRIAACERCYSSRISQRLRFDSAKAQPHLPYRCRLQQLTTRQLQILRHLALGESVKQVAKNLHLTAKSVDSHKYRIMRKLQIHDRVELTRYAIREGLMQP